MDTSTTDIVLLFDKLLLGKLIEVDRKHKQWVESVYFLLQFSLSVFSINFNQLSYFLIGELHVDQPIRT